MSRVEVSISAGVTSVSPGISRTSSKVRPSVANLSGTPAGVCVIGLSYGRRCPTISQPSALGSAMAARGPPPSSGRRPRHIADRSGCRSPWDLVPPGALSPAVSRPGCRDLARGRLRIGVVGRRVGRCSRWRLHRWLSTGGVRRRRLSRRRRPAQRRRLRRSATCRGLYPLRRRRDAARADSFARCVGSLAPSSARWRPLIGVGHVRVDHARGVRAGLIGTASRAGPSPSPASRSGVWSARSVGARFPSAVAT